MADNAEKHSKLMKEAEGQSTVEFLLSFIFVFVFLMMCVNFGINSANGYLVHYATFMASRTYMVFDNNSNEPDGADAQAFQAAKSEYDRYPLGTFIKGDTGTVKVNSPGYGGNPVYIGIYTEFKQNFSIPGMFGGDDKLNLTSESFLGREPTRATCVKRVCAAMEEAGGGDCSSGDKYNVTYFDNGC